MRGKSYSIPLEMILKKYYCSHCGAQLKREKTHRIVSKEDKDYFRYQDYSSFPRRDYDVYDYQFMCPICHRRYALKEQKVIKRIQKLYNKKILSKEEIKNNYLYVEKQVKRKTLIMEITITTIFLLIFFILYYLISENKDKDLYLLIILFILAEISIVVNAVKRLKGTHTRKRYRGYSYEEEALYEKLHTYSSNNRKLIKESDKCYCFYCQKTVMPDEIDRYLNEKEGTALCPHCGIDSIIPDAIDEEINDEIISSMNKYWF